MAELCNVQMGPIRRSGVKRSPVSFSSSVSTVFHALVCPTVEVTVEPSNMRIMALQRAPHIYDGQNILCASRLR